MMKLKRYLKNLKNRLTKKEYIKDKRYPGFWFDKLLVNDSAFIVQIGSNDGKTGDPIHPLLKKNKKWKALFVEPVPYLFEKLKNNYSDQSRFICENVAIDNGEEKLIFYWVDPKAKEALPDLPYWYDQLGSFSKSHILNQLDGKLEPFILSSQLESIDLSTLFQRNKIQNLDILHIDTEGYDWNILSQLDLKKYQPSFILYEYNHLSESDLKKSFEFLENLYIVFKSGIDMLAVKKTLNVDFLNEMLKNGWEKSKV